MAMTNEVREFVLTTAVKMALHPEREETNLLTMARKFGELGELKLMTDLYAHIERFQTCLNLASSSHQTSCNYTK